MFPAPLGPYAMHASQESLPPRPPFPTPSLVAFFDVSCGLTTQLCVPLAECEALIRASNCMVQRLSHLVFKEINKNVQTMLLFTVLTEAI